MTGGVSTRPRRLRQAGCTLAPLGSGEAALVVRILGSGRGQGLGEPTSQHHFRPSREWAWWPEASLLPTLALATHARGTQHLMVRCLQDAVIGITCVKPHKTHIGVNITVPQRSTTKSMCVDRGRGEDLLKVSSCHGGCWPQTLPAGCPIFLSPTPVWRPPERPHDTCWPQCPLFGR